MNITMQARQQGATAAEQAAAQADALAELNAAQVIFNPADGELPFPNDLLFSGSEDGTLNIPVELNADGTAADSSDPVIALNQLDGFSTVAPIAASTTEALDPTSVTLGQSVLVFSLGADGIPTPLAANQIAVQAVGNQVVLLPVQPLASNTRYLVLLTNGIMGADGRPLEGSLFYNLAKSTAPFTTGLICRPIRHCRARLTCLQGPWICPTTSVPPFPVIRPPQPMRSVVSGKTPRARQSVRSTGHPWALQSRFLC